MRSIPRLGPATGVLLLLGSTALSSPEKTDPKSGVREEARVVVVEVPVNVVDKDGHPVEGLTAEDFEITDDGKRQPVTGFEVLDQRKPSPVVTPGRAKPMAPKGRLRARP